MLRSVSQLRTRVKPPDSGKSFFLFNHHHDYLSVSQRVTRRYPRLLLLHPRRCFLLQSQRLFAQLLHQRSLPSWIFNTSRLSRSFHRIAIPYFYNAVIIRSIQQAAAIGRSLQLDSQKFLRFTSRVRTEDAHLQGAAVDSLLTLLGPRLEDLCIRVRYTGFDRDFRSSTYVDTPDTTSALQKVNPTRLGIIDFAEESEEISYVMPILDAPHTLGRVLWSRLVRVNRRSR